MSIKLDELYYEVKKYIEDIDFSKIWEGFKPLKFALYNEKECFFDGEYITKTENFLGNTSIKYNDEYIAIWDVLEDISPVILTSKIVHEMFHGFQQKHGEVRFPDEIDAIYKYKYIDQNLSLKILENELIVELLGYFEQSKFNKLLGIRKYRYNHFTYEYLYETSIEQIEGTANYVELQVLKDISYEDYLLKINNMKQEILSPKNLFPIRIISYDIGTLLLVLLHDNNIDFNIGFTDDTFMFNLVDKSKEENLLDMLFLDEEIDIYNKKSADIITKALSDNDVVMDYKTNLLGFNVYNARYYDNHIISRYFVMYGDINNPTIQYGDFVIETFEEKVVTKIYKIH